MPDPVTNNYSLTLPTVGGDVGTWGTVLNTQTFTPLDTSLGGNQSIVAGAADQNITATQFQNAVFTVTGALTGNRNVFVPVSPNNPAVTCGGRFVVVNNTTNAFNLTINSTLAGATGTVVPQGFAGFLYSDGIKNVLRATNGFPGYAAASAGDPNGQLAGTQGSVNTNASLAFDYTNAILYACTTTGSSATAVWSKPTVVVSRGFDMPVNLGLVAARTGGNLLSLAIKQGSGADATVANPIIVPFQTLSGTTFTGLPTLVSITSALSMDTNALGATLGTVANTPFRIWFALFNNGGTAVPAMQVCSNTTQVFPSAEYGVASTTSISGAATSAGVWYTPNGTTLASKAYRLIGYSDYASGLATPGTFLSNPTTTVLFGPGIKKPGDVVQKVYATTSTTTVINSGTKIATALTASVTTTSNANPIVVRATGSFRMQAINTVAAFQIYRNTGAVSVGSATPFQGNGTTNTGGPIQCEAYDAPSSANWPPTQYGVYGASGNANVNQVFLDATTFPAGIGPGTPVGMIIVEEIMG